MKSILTQVITYRLSWNEFNWLSSDQFKQLSRDLFK